MGLAASQARLLFITARINDDQYQLMKLSNDLLTTKSKSNDLADQYSEKRNAANYTFNGNNYFTYSDLMGSNNLTAGNENPYMMTDTNGNVVLDGAYGMAMQKAYMVTNGNLASEKGFNAFCGAITGDDKTNWYAAKDYEVAEDLTTVPTQTSGASKTSGTFVSGVANGSDSYAKPTSMRYATASGGWSTEAAKTQKEQSQYANDVVVKYNKARKEVAEKIGFDEPEQGLDYVWDFGNLMDGKFVPKTNSKGYTHNEWHDRLTKICQSYDVEEEHVLNGTYPNVANAGYALEKTTDEKLVNDYVQSFIAKNGSVPSMTETNNQRMSFKDWVKEFDNYAKQKGFEFTVSTNGQITANGKVVVAAKDNSSYKVDATKTAEDYAEAREEIERLYGSYEGAFSESSSTVETSQKTGSAGAEYTNITYNDMSEAEYAELVLKYCKEHGLDFNSIMNGTTPSFSRQDDTGIIGDDGQVSDAKTVRAAKYYYQIYANACNGYVVDDKITNREYLNAQLENNTYKVDGKFASENKDMFKLGLMEDCQKEKDKIDTWYKKEQNKINMEETRIQSKQTLVQTELSALSTEKTSVESIIQKNIERSFVYCQA